MHESTTPSISAEEAAALSGTYRLLARLWLAEIDAEFAGRLHSPPLRDAFLQAGGILPAGNDEATINQLAIDYCQLFLGPVNHLPPFQSVWETGQFQGVTVASMRGFVEVACYDAELLPNGLMLDHLGVQLDVMGRLVRDWSTGRRHDEVRQLHELRRSFFVQHLLWTGNLLEAAAARAQTDFYRSTVKLTRDFLDCERQAYEASDRPINYGR